ncbi:MAG: hypothetical protein ABIS84_01660 [Arachnia sp.]
MSLGIRHPSTAGVVAFQVTTNDGTITKVRLQPGYLHRAAEKLFEVRDYRALIMFADRHDWLASFSGECGEAIPTACRVRVRRPSYA